MNRRPLKIPITIHYVKGWKHIQLPITKLQEFFSVFEIDLSFSTGRDLNDNPLDRGSREDYDIFYASSCPAPGAPLPHPAKLILGGNHLDSMDINGELYDLKKRGIAAVYANSRYSRKDMDHLLEVCAHEIGHMLNLRHKDAESTQLESVMDPAYIRSGLQTPGKAWEIAIQIADQRDADAMRTYLKMYNDSPPGYPFSPRSAQYLTKSLPIYDVQPWGGLLEAMSRTAMIHDSRMLFYL
jgi:hypothetical protein